MANFLNYDFEIEYNKEKEVELVEEFPDPYFKIKKLLPRWQKHWDRHGGVFEKRLYKLSEIEIILRERRLKKIEIQMAMRQFWRAGLVRRFRETSMGHGRVYYKF